MSIYRQLYWLPEVKVCEGFVFLFINNNIFLSSDNFSLMVSFHIIFVYLFRVP